MGNRRIIGLILLIVLCLIGVFIFSRTLANQSNTHGFSAIQSDDIMLDQHENQKAEPNEITTLRTIREAKAKSGEAMDPFEIQMDRMQAVIESIVLETR